MKKLFALWQVGVNGPVAIEGRRTVLQATADAFNKQGEGQWYVTEWSGPFESVSRDALNAK